MKYAPPTDPSQLTRPGRPPKILEGHGKIREGLRQLYRDVDSILWAYRGRVPAPFLIKDGNAYDNEKSTNTANLLQKRPLEVVSIEATAEDAVEVTLRSTEGQPINFHPGQFLTLALEIDGQSVKRPYSICSSPSTPETVSIGVRKLEGGLVSTYLNESLKPGDKIGAYGPSGDYGIQTDAVPEHVVCIAGGSGITPQLSILRHVLENSDSSTATLVFVNRTQESAMFTEQLAALSSEFGDRYKEHHYLSRSKQKLTAGKLSKVLKPLYQLNNDAQFFLCGPERLMDMAQQTLDKQGVPTAAIHREAFVPTASTTDRGASEKTESLTIHSMSGHTTTTVDPGQTLLEAGLEAKTPMPYSCTMGGCGACKVKLVQGDVSMPEPNCLSAAEKESGYILSCIAHACGSVTVEVES